VDIEDTIEKLPDLEIPQLYFLATSPSKSINREEVLANLFNKVKENRMVKYYENLCESLKMNVDAEWARKTTEENEEKLKQLDHAIEDAIQNLGENDVRLANLAKADFLCRIGEKDLAESQYRVTGEKTVGIGQKLDIVFILIRIGFFYNDYNVIKRNIEKAKSMIEQGGDWDRRNRLKVYEAYMLFSIRDFKGAAALFLDTIATFTSYELYNYKQHVYYTVISSMVSLGRVDLKKQVVDSPEVKTVIHEIPHLESYLLSFYNSNYREFFISLAEIIESLKLDRYGLQHAKFYCREMRIRGYTQYLESYRSVQLSSIAEAFGVTEEFIDKELSRFIALRNLPCKIDMVAKVVETVRPDNRNLLYQRTLKQSDSILNRVQKLSRVIHL